nr:retrovirus-related Pol polyprotein from transposon TNT 1-94 [Tanacetum cinerariifolium]
MQKPYYEIGLLRRNGKPAGRVGLVHPQSFSQVVYEQEQDVELGKLSGLAKRSGVRRDLHATQWTNLELDKQISVAEKMAGHIANSFRRLVLGGIEQQQLMDLISYIDSVSPSSSKDRWRSAVSISCPKKFASKLDSSIKFPAQMDSDSDVEEDNKITNEFMADLNVEYHEKAMLANQKKFYKWSGRVGSAKKPMDKSKETCFNCGKPGHFQNDCPSNKTSTPSSNTSFNKPKLYTPSFTPNIPQNSSIQKTTKKRKVDIGKNDKGLVDELFDWDDESVSLEDKGTTKFKTFMEIAEDEPLVGKGDARSALEGKGKRKKNNSKEVLFTKNDVSTSESTPMTTSDSKDDSDNQDKKISNKVSQTYVIKKKTEPKHIVVQNSFLDKNALPLTEQLLLTLMEEVKEQTAVRKSLNKLKDQSTSKPIPVRTTRMPETFSECKYCRSNKHYLDECEFYLGREIADCPKNLRNSRKQRVDIKQSEPTKKYSKDSCSKVVFRDNSSGDTEGYGSVNYNGITFTKVVRKGSTTEQHSKPRGKFYEKADDGFFLSYSLVAKAFRVFNIRRQEMEETFYVTFSGDDEVISQTSTKGDSINFNEVNSFPDDEFSEPRTSDTLCTVNKKYFPYVPSFYRLSTINHVSPEPIITSSSMISSTSKDSSIPNIEDVVLALDEAFHPESATTIESTDLQENDKDEPINSPIADSVSSLLIPQDRWSREKHIELVNIISEPLIGITTRSRIRDSEAALAHKCLYPYGKTIIGLKWVFRNKVDEVGVVTKNKARLIAKGYKQEEGIDYDETFAPVARLEAIIIFLAYASYMGVIVYQMDMKSTFLNGKISKKVYVEHPPGFESIEAKYVIIAGCCAQVLWIKSQLADYDVLYDKEFWYTSEVEEETKTIIFLLSWLDEPLYFTQKDFIFAIGLPACKNHVPLPPKKTVRAGLENLDLVHKLQNGKKNRESNIFYTRFLSLVFEKLLGDKYISNDLTLVKPHTITTASYQKPLASKVSLTSHIQNVAKLYQEPEQSLIPPSGEMNADDTNDKSISRAS